MAREPTTAQEEPTSPRSPAAPSHGRHENGAEERAGYLRNRLYMGVVAALPLLATEPKVDPQEIK